MRVRPAASLRTVIWLVALFGLLTLGTLGDAGRAFAQSPNGVSRPWSCWTQSIAEQSIFRPAAAQGCGPDGRTARVSLAGVRFRAASPVVVPGTPESLAATVSGRTIRLTWRAPAGDPSPSYILETGTASGRSDLVNADTGSGAIDLSATDMPPGTYFMRVRARSGGGTSAPSSEVVVTVVSPAADPCFGVPDPPTGFAAVVTGPSVAFSWQAPSRCVPSGYYLEAGSASGLSNLAAFPVAGGANVASYLVQNVPDGTYFVRLRSLGPGSAISAPSNEVRITISGGCAGGPPPTAPTGFAARVSGTTVVLTWNSSGGSPSSYVLEAGSSPGASNLLSMDTGSSTTSLTADAPVGTYFVRVRGKSICGTGSPSGEVVVVVTGSASTRVWVAERTLLTAEGAGFPGQAFADVAAIQLRDGRWRLWIDAGGAMRSAISPDGLTVTMEPGTSLPTRTTTGTPIRPAGVKLFRLDNGQIRAYFTSTDMYSAVSSDEGLTFTMEAGIRVPAEGKMGLNGGSVVRLSDGRWRMYYSDTDRIYSATSTDLLAWTVDAGTRMGLGTPLGVSASHPSAILNPDGSVSLFYFTGPTAASPFPSFSGLYTSTSSDGLTFTTATAIGVTYGNDPIVVPLPGGGYRMYYNWGDNFGGTIYSLRSVGTTP
jgi:hypothetical protein